MDIALNSRSIDRYENIFDGKFIRGADTDMVIPDTMPDVGSVLQADGLVSLRGKEVSEGKITISSSIDAVVLYIPEDGGCVQRLSVNIPLEFTAEAPEIDEDAFPVVECRLVGISARTLNSRKVSIETQTLISVTCYKLGTLEVPTCAEGNDVIHIKCAQEAFTPITCVKEKTFAVSAQHDLPSALPPICSILNARTVFTAEDIKCVANKLILKGQAATDLLYVGGDDEAVTCTTITTSFSQIIDMEQDCDNSFLTVTLMPTGIYVEPATATNDCRSIECEFHFVAQVVVAMQDEVEYICDAYSCSQKLTLCMQSAELTDFKKRITLREAARAQIDTDFDAMNTVCVVASAGLPSINGSEITCPITIRAIVTDEDGCLRGLEMSTQVQTSAELGEAMYLRVDAVNCGEAHLSSIADGVEVRIPVDLELTMYCMPIITFVADMKKSEEDEPAGRRPSVMLVMSKQGDSLWDMAKAFGSTTDAIICANELEECEESSGGLLLIPTV